MAFGIETKLKEVAAEVTKAVMEELDLTGDIERIVSNIDYSGITDSVKDLAKSINALNATNMELIKLMKVKRKK